MVRGKADAQGLGITDDHPPHHGSSSTALGVDSRVGTHAVGAPGELGTGLVRVPARGTKGSYATAQTTKVPLGELLRQAGLLTAEQLTQVLTAQKTGPAVPFGQLCIELGVGVGPQLGSVLSQHGRRLFLGDGWRSRG